MAPTARSALSIPGRFAGKSVHIAIAAATLAWFGLLARRPLFDPDEGRYAEIPREMLAGGDWIVPHLNGLAYLEKPPLQYWLTALAFRLFGEGEFGARFFTGLAGYLSLLLVYLLGRRLWSVRVGIKATLFTAASVLFVLLGHQLTLDMLLSTLLLASLTCFSMAELDHASPRASARRSRAWMLGCWACTALAVLTKGLIGVLIPGATLLLYALWQRDPSVLRRLHLRAGSVLFAALTLPWFVAAARANPDFLQFFFVREHFQRFLTPIENRSEPWWFFGPVLFVAILPWLPQAVRALLLPLRPRVPPRRFDPARLMWAWSVFVLVFFSLSNAKLIPYILPAIPTLALLGAADDEGREQRDLLLGSMLSFLSCAGILVYASGIGNTGHGRALALRLSPGLTATAVLLAVAGGACLLYTRRRRFMAALALLCLGWFLAAASVLVTASVAQRLFSAKDAALALNAIAPPTAPVFSVRTYEQSMTFYLRHEVTLVDYRDEFTMGLKEHPERGIASLAQFAERWQALDQGYAVMQRRTETSLRELGVPLREIARYPTVILVSRR